MVKKKKLLFCVETIASGGVEQTRLTIAQKLIKDFDIYFICTKTEYAHTHTLFNKYFI